MSSTNKKKQLGMALVVLTLVVALVIGTMAIFSDRVNQTVSFSVATFSKDGYVLTRTAPDGYFVAGESVVATITEKCSPMSAMISEVSMSVTWDGADPASNPWGNVEASDNVKLTVDGTAISYQLKSDGSISFQLPTVTLSASGTVKRELALVIPASLEGTGTLHFSFDEVVVTKPNTQWTDTISKAELNSGEDLSYSVGVVWNISKDLNTKDIVAYLSGTPGAYGLEIIKNGHAQNTNGGKMCDFSLNKSADTGSVQTTVSKWSSNTPWYGYRSAITNVNLPEALTTIGDGAFLNLSAWSKGLTLPSTVVSVGEAAFGNASGLTSITIPNTVKTMETLAFAGCKSVRTIALGTGLTELTDYVFYDNLALESIQWGSSKITKIGTSAFEKAGQKNGTLLTLALPDSVKAIGDSAFANTNALKTLNLNKVQTIGKKAFASAQKLTALTIPANVQTLSQLSFYNCRSLIDITFSHSNSDPLTLPDASTQQGAFRLDDETGFTPLRTSIYTTRQSVKDYAWLKDNRLLKGEPILKKYTSNSAQDFHAYKSSITKITVMDHYAPPTTFTYGPWDVSAAGDESVMAYVTGTELFICSNVYSWTDVTRNVNTPVIANQDSSFLFENFTKVTAIDASGLITPNTTDMHGMFLGCAALQTLDISNFTTSLVGDFSQMFENCQALRALDVTHFDTAKASSVEGMFKNCKTLTALDVSGFDTASLKNMNSMFYGCSGLTGLDVSGWNTSSCNTMSSVFSNCSGLKTLDVSDWDTDLVTSFSGMFSGCSGLTQLDVSGFDTGRATDLSSMFFGCSGLTSLDVSGFDTSKVKNLDNTFADCFKIRMLDLKNWYTGNVVNMTKTFSRMRMLDTVVLGKDFVFQDDNGILPTPDDAYITGANGHWYDTTTWIKYTPDEVAEEHSGTVTYTAYPPVLKSIEIVTPPDKVEYMAGEDFAPAGMEVQANYSHTSYPDHSRMLADDEYTIPDGSGLTIGRTYITVSYIEDGVTKTDTQPITVTLAAPMLDDRDSWYVSGVAKNKITSINLVDTYNTAGKTIIEQWDASDESVPGTVTAYLESDGSGNGTYKLTLAGNGYGKIYANPDSYNAFAYFRQMTALNGLVSANGSAFLDTSKVTTMRAMFNYDSAISTVDVSKFDTSLVEDFGYMFSNNSKLTSVNVSNFKTGKAKSFEAMFGYCNKLPTVDVSKWDTSNVTRLDGMFDDCGELVSLNVTGWNVSKVTTARRMFQSCDKLSTLDVTNWYFTNALTNTGYMFSGCVSLPAIVVNDWVMDNVTATDSMFQCCEKVTTLDVSAWNVGSVENMSNMFNGCLNLTTLDVSKWDVSNVDWAEQMFYECEKLSSLAVDNWNVQKIENAAAMFYHCESLKTLNVSKWKTNALTTITNEFGENGPSGSFEWDRGMFEGCKSLAVIDISNWNMSKIKNNAHMFAGCTSLKALTVPASAAYISPEFAYNCTSMTEITFLHSASATVHLPEAGKKTATKYPSANVDENGVHSDGGAFYVPSYLETKITTSNQTIKNYDWATDNRAKALPILASGRTWYSQGGTTVAKTSISSVTLVDTYSTAGKTIVSQWDASDGMIGTVTAYVEDDGLGAGTYKLTLAGNGSNVIYANSNSNGAFSFGSKLKAINNLKLLNTQNATSMVYMFEDDSSLEALDLSAFNTSNVTSFAYMFDGCSSLKTLDLSSFNTAKAKTMASMFVNCKALTAVDLSSFVTSNVESMYAMFNNCKALQSLDLSHFDTGKVTTLYGTFQNCESLTYLNISNFDTSNVTTLRFTFQGCESLPSLSVASFNTSKVTDMRGTFMSCASLTSLSVNHFDTSNVTDMAWMFENCESLGSLNVSNFDTSKVTTMSAMFAFCFKIPSLDLKNFDTHLVTDMNAMFSHCSKLKTLDISSFETDRVTDMAHMFNACTVLPSLDLSHFNTENVTTMMHMFTSCYELSSLNLSGFNTEKVTSFYNMFSLSGSLPTLDLSSFRTPALTSISEMFYMNPNDSALRTVDMSGFDFSAVTKTDKAFHNCYNLKVYVADAAAKTFCESIAGVDPTVTFVVKAAAANTLSTMSLDFDESSGTIDGFTVSE